MLVKILALGLEPQAWESLFACLRERLPQLPMAAAMYCNALEIAGLRERLQGYHEESCDVLLCGLMLDSSLREQLELVEDICQQQPKNPMALVLPGGGHQLRKLAASNLSLQVEIPDRPPLSLYSPSLLIDNLPPHFPLVRVDAAIQRLIFHGGGPFSRRMQPHQLPDNSLVALDMLESIHDEQDTPCSPRRWLKKILRQAGVQPAAKPVGLLKDAKGLFLFPGVPVGEIRCLELNGLRFDYWLDTAPNSQLPGFEQLAEQLSSCGRTQARSWENVFQSIRQMEYKTDVPIWLQGGSPLLRESLLHLLQQQGHQDVQLRPQSSSFLLREPSLLLHLDCTPPAAEAHIEPPQILLLGNELQQLMQPLHPLADWRTLRFQAPSEDNPQIPTNTDENAKILPAPNPPTMLDRQLQNFQHRRDKLHDAVNMTHKRILMLQQTCDIHSEALAQLQLLLGENSPLTNWNEASSPQAQKILLLSHDPEEAAQCMHSLAHIPQRRWLDLHPIQDAETLLRFPLHQLHAAACSSQPPVSAQDISPSVVNVDSESAVESDTKTSPETSSELAVSMVLISARARSRLLQLQEAIQQELQQSQNTLLTLQERADFYRLERSKQAAEAPALVSSWTLATIQQWLTQHQPWRQALECVCRQTERIWLAPANIHHIGISASSNQNRNAVLAACQQIFPLLRKQHHSAPPFSYKPEEQSLPPNQHPNADAFQQYIQMLSAQFSAQHVHLLLIEHPYTVALAILSALRQLPHFQSTPAILLIPDLQIPSASNTLPYTRICWAPRIGSLTSDDVASAIRCRIQQYASINFQADISPGQAAQHTP